MNNYAESKKQIDKVRDKYGCKGELIFRTAIQYIVDCGQQNFSDNEWVEKQLEIVNKKHDAFDREKKNPWIGREFEKAIIECAAELAIVNTYNLLIYIQKEVFWSHEGGLDYQRAVELLKNCLNWFADDCCGCAETLERFELLDLNDNEIELLGYGYMFDVREDE